MRIRRDVWKLSSDSKDQTLQWYSVAVATMQGRMFDDPTSWNFQAAVHGYDASAYPALRPGETLPSVGIQKAYWDNCQHASWWFLPWHRIYVFLFEQMCLDIIVKGGGPKEWALPYWDYSQAPNAIQRTLPPVFRPANTGGAVNPLYASRGPGVNAGGVVGSNVQSENVSCMKSSLFSGVFPNGFGGGPSPVVQFSQYTGSCEYRPHNSMHDAIGGVQGWMDNPDAAALDPIFWLHHANIDRLWVIWSNVSGHLTPPDATWNNQTFTFFDSAGVSGNYKVSDVLQTTGPLCDYQYEDVMNPLAPKPPVLAPSTVRFGVSQPPGPPLSVWRTAVGGLLGHLAGNAMNRSQLVGASDITGITLRDAEHSLTVDLHPVTAMRFGEGTTASEATGQEVFLALENVTAQQNPVHTYEVYVNVPEGDSPSAHPELLAGLIPRFGLVKASRTDSVHGGQGLNLSFDISEIVARLEAAQAWDSRKIRVSFMPHDSAEFAAAREMDATVAAQPVKVGRVGVYVR